MVGSDLMPSFTQPAFLLLLLTLPPLLWLWLRRRLGGLRYPNTRWLGVLPAGRGWWAARGSAALRGTALAMLIVGLAGPRWPDRSTRIPTEGIAIQMVVDTSPSMAEPDFDWFGEPMTRLDAAKRAFRLVIAGSEPAATGPRFEGRRNDLAGLITFSDRPEPICPLTLSHSVLLDLLLEQKPQPVSQTNISDAVVLGLYRLKAARPKRKVLVLLSDGEHNYRTPRSEWTPRQAAQIAANLGVPVYAIDAGGDAPTDKQDGSAAVRLDGIRTLQDLARLTGGKYFQARDGDSLLAVCQEIDAQLGRDPIESFQYRRYYDAFPWFCLASFVLFVTAYILERTVWLRVP
jgi:Ca-activated chloride channel family protein